MTINENYYHKRLGFIYKMWIYNLMFILFFIK